MKASAMPEGEELAELGRSGATLAIHLSVRNLKAVVAALTPHYGADCPAAVVYRATLAGPADDPRHASPTSATRCAPPRSPARR